MSTLLDPPQGLAIPMTDLKGRWGQLALGLVCMMAISSPQYVWALFTKPLLGQLGASLAQLQVTFSILIVLQTFFSPFQGYLVDRFGPRMLLSIGAILTGASWVLYSGKITRSRPGRPSFIPSIIDAMFLAFASISAFVWSLGIL